MAAASAEPEVKPADKPAAAKPVAAAPAPAANNRLRREMPLLIRRESRTEALGKARDLLGRVGLGERLTHKPGELSGGERQRAAVARALITRPQLVLADEPTGNLDAGNGRHVLGLMLELNQELQTSLIIVTHDPEVAEYCNRQILLRDGRIVSDRRSHEAHA